MARIAGNSNGRTGLTIAEKAFIVAYISNGGNATEAYKTIKPHVTTKSAARLGFGMLQRPLVKEVLSNKIKKAEEFADQLSKEAIEARIIWALGRAKDKDDYSGLVEIDKFSAKLRGHVIDRSEVKSVNEDVPNTRIADELRKRSIPFDKALA